jgi:multiple sugar transport system substrate-binding protein
MQPLDPYMKIIGAQASAFLPITWTYGQYKGHQYGIPRDWEPDTLLYWNKDIFKSVGLNPNKPPTTWAEFLTDAAKIDKVEANGKIDRLGFVPWEGWPNIIEFSYLFGATFPLTSKNGGVSVDVNQPGFQKALAFFASYRQKYGLQNLLSSGFGAGIEPGGGATSNEFSDPFAVSKVGMMLVGPWEIQSLSETAPNVHYGITPMPVPPGGKPFLAHDGWEWMIPRGAPHAQAAAEVINWYIQKSTMIMYNQDWGVLPAVLSARNDPAITQNPHYQPSLAAEKTLGYGSYIPGLSQGHAYPDPGAFSTALEQAGQNVVYQGESPAKVIASVQQTLDSDAANQ